MNKLTGFSGHGVHEHEIYELEADDRSVIFVFPTWAGISDFERIIAKKLNDAGHRAIIVDFFGREQDLSSLDNRKRAMAPFIADLMYLQSHLHALVAPICRAVEPKEARIGSIGFCLGGLCAILSAFQEERIDRSVSFHGLLKFPVEPNRFASGSRFLILNGSRDPLVSIEDVCSTLTFFDTHNLDMTFVSLSGTYHSFMLPGADNIDAGVLYNERNAVRSWRLCEEFIK